MVSLELNLDFLNSMLIVADRKQIGFFELLHSLLNLDHYYLLIVPLLPSLALYLGVGNVRL